VWPKKLAKIFERVVTFEPVPSNWECLVKNLHAYENVELNCSALGEKKGKAKINHRKTSSGGHHMATRVDVPFIHVNQVRIDDVVQGPVDAMFLDIEGYEIEALKGAARTLKQHPLLVIENNGCSQKFGYEPTALHAYLEPMGYKQIGAFDEDLVFHAG
jgi:FkbM family methyltransferase